MDGDGGQDIAIASAEQLCLISWVAGVSTPRWCAPINDCTGGFVHPVFADLDGDGSDEIVLRDEFAFWAFDGDGTVLFQTPLSSGTLYESVVAADVDSDCAGEILVPANRGGGSLLDTGVHVFEAETGSLPGYRSLWNQEAYTGSNVADDLSIPSSAESAEYFLRQDTPPSSPTTISASTEELWPPAHQMVEVILVAADGSPVRVTSAFQDEPVDDLGDGAFQPDAVIDGGRVLLRAERAGRGDGRVYHLTAEAGHGACLSYSWLTVCVPHDQRRSRRAGECGDQGPLYDSCAVSGPVRGRR